MTTGHFTNDDDVTLPPSALQSAPQSAHGALSITPEDCVRRLKGLWTHEGPAVSLELMDDAIGHGASGAP